MSRKAGNAPAFLLSASPALKTHLIRGCGFLVTALPVWLGYKMLATSD
jgi:hypothetical protein